MSYLRSVLGAKTAILARPPGYVLQLPGDGTDVQVAERLLEQGTQSADPVGAVRHLHDALALWRGRPLADVADLAWLSAQAERLDLLQMRIRQALSEARLVAGEHARLVPELEQMVADYPLNERVHGQLMLALYRSGRQADALAVYHRLRHTLGEELGIDPSRDLRDLETAILQQGSLPGRAGTGVGGRAARCLLLRRQDQSAHPGDADHQVREFSLVRLGLAQSFAYPVVAPRAHRDVRDSPDVGGQLVRFCRGDVLGQQDDPPREYGGRPR